MKQNIPTLEGWVPSTVAADELGITRQSLNKMINKGKWKTVHKLEGSRQYVVSREELNTVKEQRSSRPVELSLDL